MRLFAAVLPPPYVLDHIAALVAAVRDAGGAGAPRWSRRDQWHITLAFYGELGDDELPGLTRRLARAAARTPPPELALSGGGAFPAPEHARVLWAGVRGDLDVLRGLAAAAATAGARAGAPRDRKAYRPHLTLARCGTPTDLRDAVGRLAGRRGDVWRATELRLMRSRPEPRPSYETVRAWPLGGGPGSPQ